MASRGVDDQLAALDALKDRPPSDAAIAQLAKALSNKSNVIVARAAAIAGAMRATSLADAMSAAFVRFVDGGDKGCLAKTAIVKALVRMEAGDESVFLTGSRLVQMEPTWGGSADSAIELRCESVSELVRRNSRCMWEPLVHLLADADAGARAVAARALGATGQDHAKYLLQYKLLVGDKEPAVMGECFAGVLSLMKSAALVAPFLDSHDEELREAAIIALGESRLPEAFELLRGLMPQTKLILLAIAMTRQPAAIEYLLSLLANPNHRAAALEALAMYRNDPAIRAKIEQATKEPT